jgi:hypothetical protein
MSTRGLFAALYSGFIPEPKRKLIMEVHPPEHGIHSWRDFFVHMGTICLGLLIAIGLEQGAESLHRRHEARDLREDLHREEEQIAVDGEEAQQSVLTHLQWLSKQRKEVMSAVWDHQPMAAAVLSQHGASWNYPYDPIYRTAQANGRTSVLSRDELYAYSDVAADVQWGLSRLWRQLRTSALRLSTACRWLPTRVVAMPR